MTDTKNPAATEHDRAVEAWRKAMQDHFDVESHDLERRLVDEAIELMRRPAATEKPAASPELLPGFYRAEFTDNEETFYFKVTDNGEWGRNVWGLSDYEGEWGYRTLGIPYQEWRDRHPGACVSADHDRGVEKRKPAASPELLTEAKDAPEQERDDGVLRALLDHRPRRELGGDMPWLDDLDAAVRELCRRALEGGGG